MFILCPQCQFLVAMEPATGLPPARCPRCDHALQAQPAATSESVVAAPPTAAVDVPIPDALPAKPKPRPRRKPEPEPEPRREPEPDPVPVPVPVPEPEPEPELTASVDADTLGEAIAQGASAGVELDSAPASTVAPSTPSQLPAAPSDDTSHEAVATLGSKILADEGPASREAEVVVPVRTPPSARPRRSATPSFVHTSADSARPSRRGPVAVLAGLTLLLALQLVLADRARLAADARWRPAITTLCNVLRCSLPAWHEPEAFTLVARDVRPARPGVLHVSASFRNDARWAQAWPALHLALQDVDGRTVGARVFAPREYLDRDVTQNDLAPGQVASVAFDVGEPPGTVVAFTFDFR